MSCSVTRSEVRREGVELLDEAKLNDGHPRIDEEKFHAL